jgi:hypothetical protein
MNIDGSSTSVDFYYGPPASQIDYMELLTFGFDDTGGAPESNYGAMSALTNGTQVLLKRDGTEYEMFNLKNNGDVALSFQWPVGTFEGGAFLNGSKIFIGKIQFATTVTLDGDDGDRIIIRVRDDLTGLLWQRASVQVFERLVI